MDYKMEVNNRKEYLENLKELIHNVSKNKKYKDIIGFNFESNILRIQGNAINNIFVGLSETFGFDFNSLLSYIMDLSIDITKYADYKLNKEEIEVLDYFDYLKMKYGFFIRREAEKTKNPFLIKSTEINYEDGSDTVSVRFTRSDYEELKGYMRFENILDLSNILNMVGKILLTKSLCRTDINKINIWVKNTQSLINELQKTIENSDN